MKGAILVVSSCTATKLETRDGQARWAESLYAGQQHTRLMRGIDDYRHADTPAGELRFRILSAHYGLVSPRKPISSYDHSFSGLPAAAIRRQGLQKNVPRDIRKLLSEPFDFGMLLLGDDYLRACDLDAHVELGGPLISFCSPGVERRMPQIGGLRTVALTNADAQRFSCGLIGLKGELGGRLLSRLAVAPEEVDTLTSPNTDVLRWLERDREAPRRALAAA